MKIARYLVPAVASCATLAGCYGDIYLGTATTSGSGASGSTTTSSAGSGGSGGAAGGTGGGLLCMPGAVQPCYDGPAGTEGQGICKAGTQVCAADGMGWGACMGQVLPLPEDCATATDEDCDGLAPPCKGAVLWAKRFGGNGDEHATGIAVDNAGDVLLTGDFNGAIDFGGGLLASAGGGADPADIFVAKLDPAGSYLWAKSFGDASGQWATAIAVDVDSNVLVTGYFSGSVDFGGGPLVSVGNQDVFIVKLEPSGGHVWSKRFGSPSSSATTLSIAADATGHVLVAGHFSGAMDFGGALLTSAGGKDAFVAKLTPDGEYDWAKRYGDAASQSSTGISVDAGGDVLVTGYYSGSLDLGGNILTTMSLTEAFAAKLDPAGNHIWSKGFGGSNALSDGRAVAQSANGDLVITGGFSGTVDFAGELLTSAGLGDVYLLNMTAAGSHAWSRHFGVGGPMDSCAGKSVAVDATSNVIISGQFSGKVDFGGGELTSDGTADAFLAKFDPMGAYQWGKRFGDAATQTATGVAADPASSVLVTGYFAGSVNLGTGPLVSAGGTDIFVAKFTP